MTRPTAYNRLYNFQTYQTNNPAAPYDGAQHDSEFNAINTALDETQAFLAGFTRSDGKLANGIVNIDALDSAAAQALLAKWAVKGAWASGASYENGDVVSNGGVTYVASSIHVAAATFGDDLAAGKWLALFSSTFQTPMTVYTGGTLNFTLDINGNILQQTNKAGATSLITKNTDASASAIAYVQAMSNQGAVALYAQSTASASPISIVSSNVNGLHLNNTSNTPLTFATSNIERMRIDGAGSFTFTNTGTGGDVYLFSNTQPAAEVAIRFTSNQSNSGTSFKLSNTAINTQATMRLQSSGAASDGGFSFYTNQAAASASTSGTESFRIIPNFAGVISPAMGLGYGTGSGGTVTQATSRVTAVTLNKPTGQITMFTAAGSATPASFVVNNSLVAATDAIVISIKGGNTNIYNCIVGAVAAGSFTVTFWTTGGVASDTPVINFAVIKGATA